MSRHNHPAPSPRGAESGDASGPDRPGTRFLVLSRLPTDGPTDFDLLADADLRAAMRDRLGLSALRKLRLSGRIAPVGRRDWHLEAQLGATAIQPCSVTLEPVTTRIEEPVVRRYLAEIDLPTASETEMPEDADAEPLPDRVDLARLAEEALALALPAFPRSPSLAPVEMEAAPPGAAPFEDSERPNPFAALAALKPDTGKG